MPTFTELRQKIPAQSLIEGIRNSSGQIRNQIGDTVWMDRRYVCSDNSQGCAGGLHIGSKNYATGWAGDGHVMVVEFSPEHVVSVPTSEHEKLRVYKYRVVGELNGAVLGDTYNSDFVRPHNASDPETVELAEEKDWEHLYKVSDWSKGQSKGYMDGKSHKVRLFYECDRGYHSKRYTKEFVDGYLAGYRTGRG
jgi:hypothetical protein